MVGISYLAAGFFASVEGLNPVKGYKKYQSYKVKWMWDNHRRAPSEMKGELVLNNICESMFDINAAECEVKVAESQLRNLRTQS